MLRVLAMLAVAAFLLVSSPADAHVGGGERAVLEAPAFPAPHEAAGASQFLVAGDAAGSPWPIAMMALLAAAALARRRSRRLVAAVLALLLAILGVEAAVHSVHHGLGAAPVACPTASMAAHLDGTKVVALALEQPIQGVGAVAVTSDPLRASLRSLDASHPRAPPAPLV